MKPLLRNKYRDFFLGLPQTSHHFLDFPLADIWEKDYHIQNNLVKDRKTVRNFSPSGKTTIQASLKLTIRERGWLGCCRKKLRKDRKECSLISKSGVQIVSIRDLYRPE